MQQLNLFAESAPVLPITYYPDFLSLEQANSLYQHCLKLEWQQNQFSFAGKTMPKLTALNVRSLSGSEVYEYLLYALPQTARRNDGRLRDGYLKRYAHVESGAWWVSGLDPLNSWLPMDWGRMKPDCRRLEWDKTTPEQTQKPVKYESPPKTPNRVTYLRVPLHIWRLISLRYDVPMPEHITVTSDGEALGFWAWVMAHPEIPVCLTEGEKKAACLLTLGYVAITYSGRVRHRTSWNLERARGQGRLGIPAP